LKKGYIVIRLIYMMKLATQTSRIKLDINSLVYSALICMCNNQLPAFAIILFLWEVYLAINH